MGRFSLTHEWNFPSNNYGQILGISDSGVETFKGTPIKSLAREICQNSLDAHRDNGEPTKVEFKVFDIKTEDIPDMATLTDAFKRALEFWGGQRSDKAKKFFKTALDVLKKQTIPCLRISDFNTTGVVGSREEYNSPWCDLTKSTGASDKPASNGGSFGIGKFAPFACSTFRTVFYSTSDIENICAYQGVSRLTSFKNRQGEITQGTGFYGADKNFPVYEQISLDPNFARKPTDFGTDIYILAFAGGNDWKEQMVASILDGFLYAVFAETLIVDVDGIIVSKETLPDLICSYKDYFKEHAEEYYQTLCGGESARSFEMDITDDPEIAGHLTLKMMIEPEFHRRVAMVRQTGMKIKDKGSISGLIPFAGVLFIEGPALNSYLRDLENPQHLEWEIERADNKAKANRLLKSLTRFIRNSLNEMKNDDSEEALDPDVGEYLSTDEKANESNQDRVESITDTIKTFDIETKDSVSVPSDSQEESLAKNKKEDPMGDAVEPDLPGDGGSGSEGSEGGGGNGGGNNPGDGGGKNPVDHRKSPSAIKPMSIRSFARNKDTGEYTLIFIPSASADNGVLEVFMSAETQNYDAEIISAQCDSCPEAAVSGNKITNLTFTAKKALRIDVQIDYSDYCSLEVKAYVY